MATVEGMMGVGLPAEVAKRTGFSIVTVTTTGTVQNSAGGLLRGAGNKFVLATAHAADGAVTLPSDAGLCDEIEIHNVSAANSADVFPGTGHTLNQLTANQGVALAAGASLRCTKVSNISWRVRLTPAITAT